MIMHARISFHVPAYLNQQPEDLDDDKNGNVLPTGQWYALSVVINEAWYCMVLHGIAWYFMVLHGIAWYCMVLHGTTWYCMALHDIKWY